MEINLKSCIFLPGNYLVVNELMDVNATVVYILLKIKEIVSKFKKKITKTENKLNK